MKKIFSIIAITLLSSFGFSQVTVETLKKDLTKSKNENQKLKEENRVLKEKLELCSNIDSNSTLSIKPFIGAYDFQVVSSKGDRASQSVEIVLLVTYHNLNQQLALNLNNSNAVDNIGNGYKIGIPEFYFATAYYKVFTDTPLKIKVNIKNILPGTESFSMISLAMGTSNVDEFPNPNLYTEIRNLKIVW